MSSLMWATALMAETDDAQAAVEWGEHFQGNYRLMTPQEKTDARARLERCYSSEYGKKWPWMAASDDQPSRSGLAQLVIFHLVYRGMS